MTDEPTRDPRLQAALRETDGDPPIDRVDWDALRRSIVERAALPLARLRRRATWWDYAARWARVAVPIGVAASAALAVALARDPGSEATTPTAAAPAPATDSVRTGRDAIELAVTSGVAASDAVGPLVVPTGRDWLLDAVMGDR